VILGAVVDGGALWQVAWVSTVAATVLVVATSLAILGAARANSERREGHSAAAVLFGTLAVLGGAVCAGAVVLAVTVMLAK